MVVTRAKWGPREAEVDRMLAAAINADPRWFWAEPDVQPHVGRTKERPRRGTSGVSERAIWGIGGLMMIALSRSTARGGRRFLVA